MKDYKVKQKREANIVSKNNKKNEANKVNGGVFVYTKALTVGELAKELNILPSEIIKYFFLNRKIVTINQTLDDDSIGEVCLQFGYDFKKEEIVAEEDFEKVKIEDDESYLLFPIALKELFCGLWVGCHIFENFLSFNL